MFIGKSLTKIRVLNDLSRNQLAERLGVTEQAIWQYENGYMSPKLEVVNKLKTIFNVKSSYFYNSDLVSKADLTNINVENIAYRSEAINSLNKTQSELMHIRFIDVFLKKVEEKIAYPKNYLVGLRNGIISFIKENSEMDRDIQIKNIAKIACIRIGFRRRFE
ncbi:helix-turn-helix transcriptional regulator [Cytobacillus firmus]|uniref:HTH cro/C1-type domain-containing protein n=1 Tax=Cytobacillus firmus TaxID=1399 RepID=A0A800NBV0_CYTFI|nr:helix-turn-helix transcriptional regulator [Cytobacillus firmus]KAF0824950.1 hypothetical protein KIS1582_1337 [Cytobacillus firmus]